jgi:hypothetical protein
MYIAYPRAITEYIEELCACEQRVRGTAAAPRVQMLRLLKSGEATNVPQVAALVGYSPRHVQRWWQTYRTAGLAALTGVYHPAGKPARLTEEGWGACKSSWKRAGSVDRKRRSAISPRPGGPVRERQRHLILVQAAQSEVEDRTPSPCQGRCSSARGLFANFAATLKELAK